MIHLRRHDNEDRMMAVYLFKDDTHGIIYKSPTFSPEDIQSSTAKNSAVKFVNVIIIGRLITLDALNIYAKLFKYVCAVSFCDVEESSLITQVGLHIDLVVSVYTSMVSRTQK